MMRGTSILPHQHQFLRNSAHHKLCLQCGRPKYRFCYLEIGQYEIIPARQGISATRSAYYWGRKLQWKFATTTRRDGSVVVKRLA